MTPAAVTNPNLELKLYDPNAKSVAGYEKQPPAEVAAAIATNAAALAATLEAVPEDGWDRTATRRDGELFTVLGTGRFVLHEGTHHLLDIGRVLRAARGR